MIFCLNSINFKAACKKARRLSKKKTPYLSKQSYFIV